MGGSNRCTVHGCSNDRRYKSKWIIKDHVPELRFHLCPPKWRHLWVKLINRNKLTKISDYIRICSNHFVLGKPIGKQPHPCLYMRGYSDKDSHSDNIEIQRIIRNWFLDNDENTYLTTRRGKVKRKSAEDIPTKKRRRGLKDEASNVDSLTRCLPNHLGGRQDQDHFDETQYERARADGLRKLKPNAVPTQFTFTPRPLERCTRCCKRRDQPCLGRKEHVQLDHSYCSTECPTSPKVKTDIKDGLTDNVCTDGAVSGDTASGDKQLNISKNQCVEELRAEVARLRRQMEENAVNSRFCLERFSASDEDIQFYTRFASHAHFIAFWRQIEPAANKMVQVTRPCCIGLTNQVPHAASAMILQPVDEFFLFMNYLSLGLKLKGLAQRFRVPRSAVSRIVNTWADFLYAVLGAVGIWMDEETVRAHLPDVFQDYSDTQIILDCVGLRCQKRRSLLLQSEVLSSRKSHCTFKGLIGLAPHGAVTFVSSLYEGAISDKGILKQSGIVPLLNPSMAVMVDEGFLVGDCLPCRVHIPSFPSKRTPLSGSEVIKTHVERLIRRVKEHKIFSTVIPLSLTASINQLYTVACLLVNYEHGPLVKA
ncbi:uncharacterized protein LOC124997338 isoform X2 [Mugil cephalus]|uniref:uncharacterized protein LOC124997338 isoform X2 n=1 Tax=Mugil cephalus TaxID=48193 RepID=UPI001FB5AC47|nr:uncharacterized protein LOC124997338 isoform X2 [Mugil cephalus]